MTERDPPPPAPRWLDAARFVSTLTPRSLVLGLVAALLAGIGMSAWEARAVLWPQFLASSAGPTVVGVGLLMVMGAVGVMDMYTRVEARAERAVQQQLEVLQAQITLQQAQITAQQAQIVEQAAQLAEVRVHHNRCQEQVAELAMLVARGGGGAPA